MSKRNISMNSNTEKNTNEGTGERFPKKKTYNYPPKGKGGVQVGERQKAAENDPIGLEFVNYGKILDDYNDRRERLVKLSRDITINSKRVIFLLQRVYSEDKEELLEKARTDMIPIRQNIERVCTELEGRDYWRYHRAFSPGIQEYLEAASFLEFLETGNILSLKKAQQDIQDANSKKAFFMITVQDYVLGIADLTGELMRMCINSASIGQHEVCLNVTEFMRNLYNALQFFPKNSVYELEKKLDTMEASLKKVEQVCFNIRLRGSEYPSSLLSGFEGDNMEE